MEARRLMGYRFVLAVLAAVTAVLFAQSNASSLGDLPTVRPVPPSETVSVDDDSFDVQIVIDNAVDLGAFQLILGYDPEVMRATSFVRGDFMSSTEREVVCPPATIDEAAARLECVSLGPTPAGPDGSGVLAIASFEPLEDGASDIIITRVGLSRVNGSSTTASVESARVTIEGDSGWGAPLVIGGIVVAGLLGAAAAAALLLNRRRRQRPDAPGV
jgi:hypothetical protein